MNLKTSGLAALSAAALISLSGTALAANADDSHRSDHASGASATRTVGSAKGREASAAKTHGTDREAPEAAAASTAGNSSKGGAAATNGYDSTRNHAEYWEQLLAGKGYTNVSCTKIGSGFSGASWTVDGNHALVVLKSALQNDLTWGAAKGQTVTTVSGKGISHVITCDGTAGAKPTGTGSTGGGAATGPQTCDGTHSGQGNGGTDCGKGVPQVCDGTHSGQGNGGTDCGKDTAKDCKDDKGRSDHTGCTAATTSTYPPLKQTTAPATAAPVAATSTTAAQQPAASVSAKPAATAPAPLAQQDAHAASTPPLAQTGANLGLALLTALGITGGGAAFVVASRRR